MFNNLAQGVADFGTGFAGNKAGLFDPNFMRMQALQRGIG
jgi:hypothetical protein